MPDAELEKTTCLSCGEQTILSLSEQISNGNVCYNCALKLRAMNLNLSNIKISNSGNQSLAE